MNSFLDSIGNDDRDLFKVISEDIKSRPCFYRKAAGEWLDTEYSVESCRSRRAEELREQRSRGLRGFHRAGAGRWSRYPNRKKLNRHFRDRLIRCLLAIRRYLQDDPVLIDDMTAARILVLTYVMTEPDADKAPLGISDFENWPWGNDDIVTDRGQGRCGVMASMRKEEGDKWMSFVRDSWRRLKPKVPKKTKKVITIDSNDFNKSKGFDALRMIVDDGSRKGASISGFEKSTLKSLKETLVKHNLKEVAKTLSWNRGKPKTSIPYGEIKII